jgi:uncharacterized Zn-finger protein
MSNESIQKRVVITAADLPLACPMPGQNIQATHPKIYLPISETHREVCKYCSTEYILESPTHDE